jgi:hypothetical protein
MQVHDSDDPDALFFRRVERAVGETMYQSAADIAIQHLPRMGKSLYALDRAVDFGREIQPQARLALLVVRDSFQKLRFRLRVESEVHFA